jgi:hypothetical protein
MKKKKKKKKKMALQKKNSFFFFFFFFFFRVKFQNFEGRFEELKKDPLCPWHDLSFALKRRRQEKKMNCIKTRIVNF